MNAITPITAAHDGQRKAAAALLWSQQRGKLIDAFTKTEFEVTQTLQVLASIEGQGAGIKISPNLQGRFAQLLKLFAPAGAFASEGKSIWVPLDAISRLIDLRNMICHGRSTLYFDENGRWIVQLEMLTVVKGCAVPREALITQDAVKLTLKSLNAQASITASRLAQLRKNLTTPRKATPSSVPEQASR
ncbi:hypothetical protein [Blastomonas sp. AAP53]|uniref:hypothetical protein n=1 Tax=Blastomonas sp. AAP53 TaxID=1248760 RepID=UPI0003629CC9|nr:hypothetical protein [Blastomonas sp. AAP53]